MSSTISGNLHVANDVLADLVGNAAMECYGVVGMTAPNAADGIAKILPTSRLRRAEGVRTGAAGRRGRARHGCQGAPLGSRESGAGGFSPRP